MEPSDRGARSLWGGTICGSRSNSHAPRWLALVVVTAILVIYVTVARSDAARSLRHRPAHPTRRSQVVLRSSDGGGGGDPLPPPPAGLGYYTRSQAADVFLRFHGGGGGDVDWRAWEERLEDQAPPVADPPSPTDAPGPSDTASRPWALLGGLTAALAVAARSLARPPPDGPAAAGPLDLPSIPNGQVPRATFRDIPGFSDSKALLQPVLEFLKQSSESLLGAALVGASRSDGLALAAAVAGEAGVPWFSLTLPAESEALPAVTAAAAAAGPCVVALDLAPALDIPTMAAVLSMTDRFGGSSSSPVAVLAVVARTEDLPTSLRPLFGCLVPVGAASETRVDLDTQRQRKETDARSAFWKKVDDTLWDFVVASKEKKWNPDRRGDTKEVARRETSSLSWGGYRPVVEDESPGSLLAIAAAMKAQADVRMDAEREREAADQAERRAGQQEVLDSRVYMEATLSDVPEGLDRVLTGRQLAELCYAKYGQYYDMALLQWRPLGDAVARQIAFNIYGGRLGSSNFSYSEEQYLQKLEIVAQILNRFDQAWYVRRFLQEPIRPRRGLPSTPRSDTAVTLRLNTSPTWRYLPEAVVREHFP